MNEEKKAKKAEVARGTISSFWNQLILECLKWEKQTCSSFIAQAKVNINLHETHIIVIAIYTPFGKSAGVKIIQFAIKEVRLCGNEYNTEVRS